MQMHLLSEMEANNQCCVAGAVKRPDRKVIEQVILGPYFECRRKLKDA